MCVCVCVCVCMDQTRGSCILVMASEAHQDVDNDCPVGCLQLGGKKKGGKTKNKGVTFRVLHRALFSCGTQLLYRPNSRPRIYARCAHIRKSSWPPSTPKLKLPMIRPKLFLRTFIGCRFARTWKNSRPLLTPKTNLLMIFTPRIDSVCHVFSLIILTMADQNL